MNDLGCDARGREEKPHRMPKVTGAAVAAAMAVLSACSNTTYGTGTPTDQQLVNDLTGVLSLGPKDKPAIDYSPRPGIVKPPSTDVLPPPQESVASAGNPAWPESPEERRARLRAEATANQDNPFYRPKIVGNVGGSGAATQSASLELSDSGMVKPDILTPGAHRRAQQRQVFLDQQRATQQGSPTSRRYLSEPPVEYRQPSATAPAGELGEDEAKKERMAKKAGSGTGGLRKLLPWLN